MCGIIFVICIMFIKLEKAVSTRNFCFQGSTGLFTAIIIPSLNLFHMKSLCLPLLSSLLLLLTLPATAEQLTFFTGSLNAARVKANKENKYYFALFTADWCKPCLAMKQKTFTNPDLIRLVESNFIPVQVNIDDFDGYAYKGEYNVKVLPTLIIFNGEGKQVARFEESMNARRMMEVLSAYLPKSGTPIHLANSVKPAKTAATTPSKKEPEVIYYPALKPDATEKGSENTKVAPPKPLAKAAAPAKKPEPEIVEMKVNPQSAKGFSIQVGNYGKYSNIVNVVKSMQEKFPGKQVLFHISANDQKETIYKVLLGRFNSHDDALIFMKQLKAKAVPGFIVDLSKL